MQIEPLNLSHREILDTRFRQLNLSLSEYSFANLYLFREIHRYEVIKCNEEIFIKGITRDQVPFLMFTSDPSQLSLHSFKSILNSVEILFPIPDQWMPSLRKFVTQMSFKEAESDYLFSLSKLASFAGRHLSAKRNLVKQLLNQHEIKGENLLNQLEDAQLILESWMQELTDRSIETDYQACREAIRNFQTLHLHGRILYLDQFPAGFTIGEWITKDCYVIHFSKASRTIKGLYQYLYQDLAQSLEGTCSWINLEQDLGIQALRYSKLSYLPDQLLHKWRVQMSF